MICHRRLTPQSEAIAVGLREVLAPDLLGHRIQQVAELADELHAAGVPVQRPAGRDPATGENRGRPAELVRLAVPRRTYTARQLHLVIEAAAEVMDRRDGIPALPMVHEPAVLRHSSARFEAAPQDRRLTA